MMREHKVLQLKLSTLLTLFVGGIVAHSSNGLSQGAQHELLCERIFQNPPTDYRVPKRRVRGGGFNGVQTDISLLREHLLNLVLRKAARNDRTIKVALGGTLAFETQLISDLVLEVIGLTPAGSDWKIEISAYSIVPDYLLQNEAHVRSRGPSSIRYRFELLDLMDPIQVRNMTRRRPDVVIMLNSLYINQFFSFESLYRERADGPTLRRLDSDHNYFLTLRDLIFDVLPTGGVFAIERLGRGQGLPPGRFTLIPSKTNGIVESGLYIKPSPTGR